MDKEIVYYETIPYDVQLRFAMSGASRVIARYNAGAARSELDKRELDIAINFLQGAKEVEPSAQIFQSQHGTRLIADAFEALDIPSQADTQDVQLLLSRTAATLEQFASGSDHVAREDLFFADTVIGSMRELAAIRRAQPTDVVLGY
jgi:hypothetical protein